MEEGSDFDWSKCVLCQEDMSELLVDPSKVVREAEKGQGYISLVENLESFNEVGQLSSLPFKVELQKFTVANLLEKNGKYHKSCRALCSASRLKRAIKRAAIKDVKASPVKTRRQSEPFEKGRCLFCNCPGTRSKRLSKVATKETSDRIISSAQKIGDRKILAKVEGAVDLIALEAEYHISCLTGFYNKLRSMQNEVNVATQNERELKGYALACLIGHIQEQRELSEKDIPCFTMPELAETYRTELQNLGFDASTVHTTRLKDRLLDLCPYLHASIHRGQDTLITFREDVDLNLRKDAVRDYDGDALTLLNASKIVRSDMFNHVNSGWEEVTRESQINSIPKSLYTLVKMILIGPGKRPKHHENDTDGFDQVVSSLAQLLHFHAVKEQRKAKVQRQIKVRHHLNERETPVPVSLAMKIYGESRSKGLIEFTHHLGLSISYDRLQNILTETANKVCYRYQEEDVVCPPNLQQCLFTTGAVDNIDHDTSASTAKQSFHGTAITLMQHSLSGETGIERTVVELPRQKGNLKVAELPLEYTNVKPCFLNIKNGTCPAAEKCTLKLEGARTPLMREEEWLQQIDPSSGESLNWSTFHGLKETENSLEKTKIACLPLFTHPANNVAMMLHAMDVIHAATQHLNPGQTTVVVADQPLFAIMNLVQYVLPEKYGKGNFFISLGGLHIEMAALRTLGQWLAGSGWVSALVDAGVTTPGRADAMLKATHVTRTRYAHQVTAAALFALQKSAYEDTMSTSDNALPFSEWREEMRNKKPQFRYWDSVFLFELSVLQFVKSIRTASYDLYIESLIRLSPWFFALDHPNYSRWVPVDIRNHLRLETENPDLHYKFKSGKFVAKKTDRAFSCIALDQMHEQVNAQLKGNGGMVGLTESPGALRKWMLAGPELARMVTQFEDAFGFEGVTNETKHHSSGAAAQINFNNDVNNLIAVFEEAGNPFLDDGNNDLYCIDTKRVVSAEVVNTVMNIELAGEEQYQNFVDERLVRCSRPISDPIKQNNYPTFSTSTKSSRGPNKTKSALTALKDACKLFGDLYIACQSRSGDLDKFFQHENQPFPPALSDMGQLRSCDKSDLVDCLLELSSNSATPSAPQIQAKFIDGAAIVRMLQPGTAKTFQEYAENVFMSYIRSEACEPGVCRLDVVFDRYISGSLKSETRSKRGSGIKLKVTPATKMPKERWQKFLSNSDNKSQLFQLLANQISSSKIPGVELISTRDTEAVSSIRDDIKNLSPCNHEEADTRLLLHVAEAAAQGISRVLVRSRDTDVVVLCVANFDNIEGLEELWVSIGTKSQSQYVAAHELAKTLGPERSTALPIFHAFSGCDTTSSFCGRGKKTAFDVWENFPDCTAAFLTLGSGDVESSMPDLQQYVVMLYDRTANTKTVNQCRRYLFTKRRRRLLEAIPPTLNALEQHVLRAAYQGGYVWGQCLKQQQILPDPAKWGWKRPGEEWEPVWTTVPLIEEALIELVKCGCKKGCLSKCKCKKANLPCTELCECGGCQEENVEE